MLLKGITCPENNFFEDKHFDFGTEVDFHEDEENVIESTQPPTGSGSSVILGKTCVICLEATSDVLLSCGHFKYCLRCFEKETMFFDERVLEFNQGQRDVEPQFKCPLCQQVITSHIHVEKIFVD